MPDSNKEKKNRTRNKVVAFRVSPEEWTKICKEMNLCGYQTKQEYIMDCLLEHRITAKGNPKMVLQLKKELQYIRFMIEHLKENDNAYEELSVKLLRSVDSILEIMQALANAQDNKLKQIDRNIVKVGKVTIRKRK